MESTYQAIEKNNNSASHIAVIAAILALILIVFTFFYFKNSYESEWIETELAKKMIKDVDDSDVLSAECINMW